MDVWAIRTPTDLRDAFADSARAHFIVPNDLEPAVRDVWDEIFEDFTLIEPALDPLGLVSSYLDSVAEPIARLRELGVQLVAVKGSGTIARCEWTDALDADGFRAGGAAMLVQGRRRHGFGCAPARRPVC